MEPATTSNQSRQVVVVLENCSLETVKTKKGFELLHVDEHKSLLTKHKKDPSEYRADIVHQVLLTLLDSPLNKAGHLKVFMHTRNNILIEVNPEIRIPRTFKRFCGLMVQLLHKLSIRAADSRQKLLKVVKNPVTIHLPIGALRIGTSVTGELVEMDQFVMTIPDDQPVVFMFGAHAHGKCEVDWADRYISVSQYPLSASTAVARVLNAFEKKWDIL
ncbi:Ribosomal RNA small subunit methyltransferase NEP1 [Plasmodiophora brassicae]|uniref:Ribosomal RNA small subunit methyltransferase NEP1 n=1 Tax=Plasmodiophora brassicae TaxID=37360 RepID=A0A0G4J2M1_PLABS|nr:hypothetical protein PBRA_008826 [Plasmodiophora brassicae]